MITFKKLPMIRPNKMTRAEFNIQRFFLKKIAFPIRTNINAQPSPYPALRKSSDRGIGCS
jgi:hypothetical protein